MRNGNSGPSEDQVDDLQKHPAETFNATDHPGWTFICGSVTTVMLKVIDTVFESNPVKTRNSVVQNLS